MQHERRRVSPLRLLIVILALAGSCLLVWSQVSAAYYQLTQPAITTWFAPYVDTTLTPTLHFEDPLASPTPYSVLGFIVADSSSPCTPTWGTYFSLDGAGRELDLDRRITRLRARGGDVIISFGGVANNELAVSCSSQSQLLAAYRTVVDRYGVQTLDFDVEGAAEADAGANSRRATALRSLQVRAAHLHRQLKVWLTLPVIPQGLTREGVSVVESMLHAGVKLSGANALIMDYGGSLPAGESMRAAGNSALHGMFHQLQTAYRGIGARLTDRQIWGRIGATPMIGQNDSSGEYFSLSDANALVEFARSVHLGRVSMWSANRDYQCSRNADTTQVSNVCSGIQQDAQAFTWELGRLNGSMPAQVHAPDTSIADRAPSRDDPRTSPYPIWVPSHVYSEGEKVVWHGAVYEAKWWNQSAVPDQSVDHAWDTPWLDLGPVLTSDLRSAVGTGVTAPQPWSPDQVYVTGDRVVYHKHLFTARWWTQGETPQLHPARPEYSSWSLVGAVAQRTHA
jgi:chitinase